MIVQDFSLPITPEEYSFRASRIGAEVFANSQLMPGWLQVGFTLTAGSSATAESHLTPCLVGNICILT